ncbi:hypothetical protein FACS1894216_15960 [Synergistales bacterium]|nr:hypothetical protein FACS1894216_15960 [Synergistales bacterium]
MPSKNKRPKTLKRDTYNDNAANSRISGKIMKRERFSLLSALKSAISKIRFDAEIFAGRAGKAISIAVWGCLLVDIFLIMSVFTRLTGALGNSARNRLVGDYGGGVLIILLFFGYICVSIISGRKIPGLLRQITGTAALYLCATLLLGLFSIASKGGVLSFLLFPGSLGDNMAGWAVKNIGPLGTTITGLAMIVAAMYCYGFTLPLDAVLDMYDNFRDRLYRPKQKREISEDEDDDSEEDGEYAEEYDGDEEDEDGEEEYCEESLGPGEYPPEITREEARHAARYEYETPEPARKAPEPVYAAPELSRVVPEPARCVPELQRSAAEPSRAASEPAHGATEPPRPANLRSTLTTLNDDKVNAASHQDIEIKNIKEIEQSGVGRVTEPSGQFPPPIEIFGKEADESEEISEDMALPWGEKIISSLKEFGVEAELADILIGPTVIQFRIQPAPGVKVSSITARQTDLAMALAVSSLRVEAPIPGKPFVGIEIPNPKRRGITLRSIIEEDEFQKTDKSLPLPMGVTINGEPLVVGLEDMPHLLVAGTTGSGKSVFVNSCIIGLCSKRRPDELRMVLVDPKRVEMAAYKKLPHILTPPVTDPKKAVHVLGWMVRDMERRYGVFEEYEVKNLASYNAAALPKDRLPHVVIVVDELADLMMTAAKEVEDYICRLAQKARATGIHLMLATQRPSVNVITGLIKANVPARVAFTLPSMMDSRTILDSPGAEKLLGRGDMLFMSTQYPKAIRIQSPWIDERSISRWMNYLINTFGEPIYMDIDDQESAPAGIDEEASFDDAFLDEAIGIVISSGMASASGLQRRLSIGYTRAGRLIDMMEKIGIIGPSNGAKPREIFVDEDGAKAMIERLRSK